MPRSSPLDAALPDREAAAASVIRRARLIVGRRFGGRVIKVRAGQAGRVIIESEPIPA